MARGVFTVRYEEFTDNDKQATDTGARSTVTARSAEDAIAKVRDRALKQSWTWHDDDGKEHTSSITSVRILSVEHVCDLTF